MTYSLQTFWAFSILFFLCNHSSISQVVSSSITDAYKVHNEIDLDYLTTSDTGEIRRLDATLDNQIEKVLDTVSHFQLRSDQLVIYSEFLNPMKYRISIDEEIIDDELFMAQQEFLTSVVGQLDQVGLKLKFNSDESESYNNVKDAISLEKELLEILVSVKSIDTLCSLIINDLYKEFEKIQLFKLQDTLTKHQSEFFEKLISIKNINEIDSVLRNNETKIKKDMNSIEDMNTKLNVLRSYIDRQIDCTNISSLPEKAFKAYILMKIDELVKRFSTNTTIFYNVQDQYETYAKLFKAFKNKKIKKDKKDQPKYELLVLEKMTRKKKSVVTITLEEYVFNSKDKSLRMSKKKKYLLHVRRHRNFIPVISSGLLYSNLSFANYGTDTDDSGNTIVTRSEDVTNEITLGAYLNMYLNNDWENPVFWQFGLGPSKEKPLFFLGGGISIGKRINISAGTVFTWFPELSNLTEGDLVSGTSIIEDDIVYKFDTTPKFYMGFNFDISKK